MESTSQCHQGDIKLHNLKSTYCNIHSTCKFCECGCYKKSEDYISLLKSRGGKLAGGLY